jgi:predicted DNA-binding transcriptional regulator AlpA
MATASILDALISEADLAERLGVCRTSLWRLRSRSRNPLPFVKLGGAIKYHVPEVEAWLLRGGAGAGPRSARVASR